MLSTQVFSCPVHRDCRLGQFLFEQQNYYDAITEFYRTLCFDSSKTCAAEAYYFIGLCERELENWDKSARAFEQASIHTNDDHFKQMINTSIAATHIAQGNLVIADLKLRKILLAPADSSIKNEARMLLFISSILQKKWSIAGELLNNLPELHKHPDKYKTLVREIEKATSIKKKSAHRAKLLSTLIPGAGQLYAEDYRNSVNAFLLNSFNFSLNTILFINGYYLDGILYFISFTERYYSGNRYQAGQSVLKRESYNDKSVQDALFNIISEINAENNY